MFLTKLLNKKIKQICYDLHHVFEIKFGFLRLNIIVKNTIEILLEKGLGIDITKKEQKILLFLFYNNFILSSEISMILSL